MSTLIHNMVKTDRSDYTFNTREEAEAFFIAVSLREKEHPAPAAELAKPALRRGTSATGRSGPKQGKRD